MVVMDVFTRRIVGFGVAVTNLDGPGIRKRRRSGNEVRPRWWALFFRQKGDPRVLVWWPNSRLPVP